MCILYFNILQKAQNQLYRGSTSYEVCTITLSLENLTSMPIKSIVESRCLTRTSDNSKYFLWSHRLRVNEFQLYDTKMTYSLG